MKSLESEMGRRMKSLESEMDKRDTWY